MMRPFLYSLCLIGLSLISSLHAQYEALITSEETKPEVIIEQKRQAAMGPLRLVAPSSHSGQLLGMEQSPDGKYLLTYDQDSLKIWDCEQRVPFIEKNFSANNASQLLAVHFTHIPRQVCVISKNNVSYYDEFNFNKYKWSAQASTPYRIAHWYAADEAAVYVLKRSPYYDAKTSQSILLTLVKITADTDSKHTKLCELELPLDSFGPGFYLKSPTPDWTLTASKDRQSLLFAAGTQHPSLEINPHTGAHRMHPAQEGLLGYLPDGSLLTAKPADSHWAYHIITPESDKVLRTIPTHSQDAPRLRSIDFPNTIEQILLLPTEAGFVLYDFQTQTASQETRPTSERARAVSNFKTKEATRPLLAMEQRDGSSSLQFFDAARQVFRGPWMQQAWTPDSIYPQGDRFEFAAVRGNSVRLIHLNEAGLQVRELAPPPSDLQDIAVFIPEQDGAIYYIDGKSPQVAMLDSPRAPTSKRIQLSPTSYTLYGIHHRVGGRKAIAITPDAQSIALLFDNRLVVCRSGSSNDLEVVATIDVPNNISSMVEADPILAISDDGNRILYGNSKHQDGEYRQSLTLHDLSLGKELWRKEARYDQDACYMRNLKFIEGGTHFVASNNAQTKIAKFQTVDGAKVGDLNDYYANEHPYVYSPKGSVFSRIATASKSASITQYALPSAKPRATIQLSQKPDILTPLADSHFLLAHTLGSSSLQLIDSAVAAVVADLYLFENTNQWLVRNPETGLFTSNQDAHANIFYVKGDQINPLAAYFDKFYRPRLLGSLINGLSPKPTIRLDKLRYAPRLHLKIDGPQQRGLSVEDEFESVEIATDTVTLNISASCEGSPIKDIRIYQNGKLVSGGTRGLFVEDDEDAPSDELFTQEASYTFPLAQGKNRFRAIAINEQETESVPDEIIVYSANSEESDSTGMRLHLFVIGINEYSNSDYNLNYAVADAEAISQSIKAGSETIYSQTKVYQLKNSEATRENIIGILENIQADATARDSFIFFFAGHGVVSEDEYAEFYLAPADMTQLYGDRSTLQKRGLSSYELLEYSRDIAAQKQLFILDACQSEGALKTVAMRGAAEEQAIAQLARSTGTHWLTATASDQTAIEFKTLGHGAFTYTLLEALNGKADTGDGIVSVNELKAYIEARVPEVTEAHKGSAQYPASYGYGQDFPIALPE
ncbi:caspase family protein [Coraliomargarita algicola]|uniref:Caspase family protein n=1 Tax=Coraliomargarita algicola TaxID=3092156 RepID=A0ABZ0RLD7_9BACT|nr:caspase family protein [Coraliomargarita sp. J2-16]WPJ95903.1 caspase family protein [Coraliomargarita sp. J2-16]